MRTTLLGLIISIYFLCNISFAIALPQLNDWAFNIDGEIYENFAGDTMPLPGTLGSNGLGTLEYTINEMGMHSFFAFFDYEIIENQNTFFNEYGFVANSAHSLQQWEIDEPGYVFGDIYDNVLNGTLDNTNSIPQGCEDDVSWAMGWDFMLNDGDTAIISLILSTDIPDAVFYLAHVDSDTGESLYFSSTLVIDEGGAAPVPEPSTILLFFSGIVLFGFRKKDMVSTPF